MSVVRVALVVACGLVAIGCAGGRVVAPPRTVLVAPTPPKAVASPTDAAPTMGPSRLDARQFTVEIVPVDPGMELPGTAAHFEPSLVPLRDAMVVRLRDKLAANWHRATRGLSVLTIVPAHGDIVLYVVPARGSSLLAISANDARQIVLFVQGDLTSAEYFDVSALHELGHLWCCFGVGAGADGHWLAAIADATLAGVDRYGVMNHPVACPTVGAAQLCPQVFSVRELAAMGFTVVPTPSPDPCVARSAALQAQVAAFDTALVSSRLAIEAREAQLEDVVGRIRAIEGPYPSGVLPADLQPKDADLRREYDARIADLADRITRHNATVRQRDDVVARAAAELC